MSRVGFVCLCEAPGRSVMAFDGLARVILRARGKIAQNAKFGTCGGCGFVSALSLSLYCRGFCVMLLCCFVYITMLSVVSVVSAFV